MKKELDFKKKEKSRKNKNTRTEKTRSKDYNTVILEDIRSQFTVFSEAQSLLINKVDKLENKIDKLEVG